jgi:hypothetical protein
MPRPEGHASVYGDNTSFRQLSLTRLGLKLNDTWTRMRMGLLWEPYHPSHHMDGSQVGQLQKTAGGVGGFKCHAESLSDDHTQAHWDGTI